MIRARYNRQGWPLTLRGECARARYCEPHGTKARCQGGGRLTESVSIPFRFSVGLREDVVISLQECLALVTR